MERAWLSFHHSWHVPNTNGTCVYRGDKPSACANARTASTDMTVGKTGSVHFKTVNASTICIVHRPKQARQYVYVSWVLQCIGRVHTCFLEKPRRTCCMMVRSVTSCALTSATLASVMATSTGRLHMHTNSHRHMHTREVQSSGMQPTERSVTSSGQNVSGHRVP